MIGILGGTFDPIHFGHLRTALEVAEHFGIPDMRLIPGKVPPHRPQPVATPEQRLTMLQAAIASEPCLQADDRELRRDGYSYSFDTLTSIRAEVGGKRPLLFTLGFDAFQHFQSWHRWQEILQLAHLVVVHRPGYSLPPEGWHTPFLGTNPDDLHTTPAGNIYSLAVTALDISATDLRTRLKAGKNPRYLLPDTVLGYIQTHQLYCET
ncbi:nicotinate-nucleotide adenylyltransferase [Thiothrix nivea]|uniref:Probable nicotinate-nucleotide adenylyltransferase n=1 Tax=Thiothrix nivea (strain ATCC 35100 / DSM 5205 / JP2) TaxID=870187 RepID=A0A656HHA9_THINJ|nr:nicotinate-nucleotide adenylyltransferase [Thiothrix nivea]EIJ36401.1 nicotinate-nucleotide adenylyltransferase [Thiothrix nivea DSM 5205]